MAFDIKLMEILACPVCKGKLDYQKEQQELICKFDRLAYPIEKDILEPTIILLSTSLPNLSVPK